MEIPEEYNLAGQPWEKKEDEQLIKEYTIDRLNLMDISKIHKRMPGGIVSRLIFHKLIVIRSQARGYIEYQQSDLYKEICKHKVENRLKRNTKYNNPDNTAVDLTDRQTTRLQIKQIPSDIIQIKEDIKEIKKNVSKILEIMNVLYEFEVTQA